MAKDEKMQIGELKFTLLTDTNGQKRLVVDLIVKEDSVLSHTKTRVLDSTNVGHTQTIVEQLALLESSCIMGFISDCDCHTIDDFVDIILRDDSDV